MMSDVINVGNISDTQRITLKSEESGVVLQKEYRKNSEEDWRVSKGIKIPNSMMTDLACQLTKTK